MSYSYTFDGSIDQRLMLREMRKRKRNRSFSALGLSALFSALLQGVLVGAGGIVVAFLVLRNGLSLSDGLVGWAAPISGAVLGFAALQWNRQAQTKWFAKQLFASPVYERPMTISVTDAGFEIGSKSACWSIAWNAVEQVRSTPEAVTVYAGNFCYVLPMAHVPEDERADVAAYVKRMAVNA